MKRFLVVLILAGFAVGCGGSGDRGKYRDQDRPKSGDRVEKKDK